MKDGLVIPRSIVAVIVSIATSAAILGTEAPPAPDLEIVALQSVGPGRVGDCNSVVARLHNRGAVATSVAPAVRLDITGAAAWSSTKNATAPLQPGTTVEVWFEHVPLPAGLSQVLATSDPEGHVPEADETNNTRLVPRDPQAACGAPDPPPPAGLELRVRVIAAGAAQPIEGATLEVTSPLRAGVVMASGVTDANGAATLTVPFDSRTPVLRVTATRPGCPPGVQLATPSGDLGTLGAADPSPGAPKAPIDLTIELRCSAQPQPSAPIAKPGTLAIETALPGRLQIDDRAPAPATFGTRLEVERPGASVRVRLTSANGTVFFDESFDLKGDAARKVVIDAPPLRARGDAGDVIEDLRTGLLWSVGAPTTPNQPAAVAICEALVRDGADDWRLPEIDDLAFVLEAHLRSPAPLDGLSDCCLWSMTEQIGDRLTFYLDGGHIYGRNTDEGGVGALCVRGSAYAVDPLLVPARYHDRLPGDRRFRPRD